MKNLLILLTITLSLLVSTVAHAASVTIVAPGTVNVEEVFSAEVFLDTEGDSVNALEGSVVIPEGMKLREVRYLGSVVSLWLESPKERAAGIINFAGVLPGGYEGNPEKLGHGNLFTLILSADSIGTKNISVGPETVVYANNGEGTPVVTTRKSQRVAVVTEGAPTGVPVLRDIYPPESFTPLVVSGEPYGVVGDVVVFATQDKDSGIEHFDVSFSYIGFLPEWLLVWRPADSPYTLQDPEEKQYVFVRAVDVGGNTRVASIPPQGFSLFAFILTWIVPGILGLLGIVLIGRLALRRRKVSLK